MNEKMNVIWMDVRDFDPEHSWEYYVTFKWCRIHPCTFEVESGTYVRKVWYQADAVPGIIEKGWYEKDVTLSYLCDEHGEPIHCHDTVVAWAEIPEDPEPYDPSKN